MLRLQSPCQLERQHVQASELFGHGPEFESMRCDHAEGNEV